MREIKYRGLSVRNRWVYGLPNYSHGLGEWKMARSNGWKPTYNNPDEGESTEWINVDPETIGQFTGLKDKNGVEIYEGDIVKFHYFYESLGQNLGVIESEAELIGVVKYQDYGWGINAITGEHWSGYTGYDAGEGNCSFVGLCEISESSIHEESFEVIGNIHTDPELLK